jgi:hypothetical protein
MEEHGKITYVTCTLEVRISSEPVTGATVRELGEDLAGAVQRALDTSDDVDATLESFKIDGVHEHWLLRDDAA